jgi:protein-S-isoprenylcysteine O-methyltransferase Ste14
LATVAIWLLIAFATLAFGVRVGIQLYRTGSTGLAGLRRGATRVEWLAGILFLAGMTIGAASIVLVLNDELDPVDWLDTTFVHVIGLVLACAGGLAVFAAQLGMGESWRIGVSDEQDTSLVTGGWFSVVRNPIYSAMVVGWTGFAILVPTRLALVGLALLITGVELQVRRVEEPYLLRAHGDDFRAYAARVGRFVPGVGLLR